MTETLEIKLGTTDHVAIIDAADAHLIEGWRLSYWKPRKKQGTALVIARRYHKGRTTTSWLHRLITGVTDPTVRLKHKDGNGLNCRRSNIKGGTPTLAPT